MCRRTAALLLKFPVHKPPVPVASDDDEGGVDDPSETSSLEAPIGSKPLVSKPVSPLTPVNL